MTLVVAWSVPSAHQDYWQKGYDDVHRLAVVVGVVVAAVASEVPWEEEDSPYCVADLPCGSYG